MKCAPISTNLHNGIIFAKSITTRKTDVTNVLIAELSMDCLTGCEITFTNFSPPSSADISKATAHERIQHLYHTGLVGK
jgi:hypothetical protein